MNQGLVQSSLLQQMGVAGSSNWPWSINNNTQPPPHHQHHSFLAAPPHNHIAPQPWTCSQDLPESWSQLFTGLAGEDVKAAGMNYVQATDLDNWEQQLLHPTSNSSGSNRKQQNPATYDPANLEFLQAVKSTDFSSPKMASASPSKTCIATSSVPSDIFGFSNKPSQISVKCNSTATGGVAKKARINPTSSAQTSIKVRKEKLGDRITALHQLVSPFGKTDTASVLLEAIGYIRFLQRQIEALSVPHLGSGSGNMIRRQQPLLNENSIKRKATSGQEYRDEDEPKKDLKSRGLCLVPISSCTVEVGSDSIGADYWTQSFGANFK